MKKKYILPIIIVLITFVSCIPGLDFKAGKICSTTNNDAEIIADGIAYIEQVYYDKVEYRNTGINSIKTKDNSDKREIKYYSASLDNEITVTFIRAYMNASYTDENFEYNFWEKESDYMDKFLEAQNNALSKTYNEISAENFSGYKIFYDVEENLCVTPINYGNVSEKEKCIMDERLYWPKLRVYIAVYNDTESSCEELTENFVSQLNALLKEKKASLPDVKIYYLLTEEIYNKFTSGNIHKDTESLTSERYECKCTDEGKFEYKKN